MEKSNCFEFEIISPLKICVEQVEWIDVAGAAGNFVVGPDHCELISLLKKRGKITYKRKGENSIDLDVFYGGIFKVKNNKATVLLEQ